MAVVALVLVAFVVIGSVTILLLHSFKIRKLKDKVPGPAAIPLLGNAHQLRSDGSDFYAQLMEFAESHKDTGMFSIWLGMRALVAIYRPNLVEALLSSTKHIGKAPDYRFLHPWLGTGLLTSTGTKWHNRRKMLTPTFHFKILQDFVRIFSEQGQVMLQKLTKKADNEAFNIFPYITLCALDIICETAMGKHVNAQRDSDSDYVTAVYKMSTIIQNRMKKPWQWPNFLFNTIGPGKEHKDCLRILQNFTQQVIKEKRKMLAKTNLTELELKETEDDDMMFDMTRKRPCLAFLDMLMYMTDDGIALSNEDIQEEVDTFMFEGHDTTAAGMNWAIHLIGAHPEIQERVHKELDSIFGNSDRMVTIDDLKNMKYLELCIKEALRLFPSVPLFGRMLTEDAEIGGAILPRGTTVVVMTFALHRDPHTFPDPEVFNPDRFLPENIRGRHPYAYVPFSAGMRNCIGQKFAMMEEKIILSTVFRNFSVKALQKRHELRPDGELILRPEKGIIVKLTKRH